MKNRIVLFTVIFACILTNQAHAAVCREVVVNDIRNANGDLIDQTLSYVSNGVVAKLPAVLAMMKLPVRIVVTSKGVTTVYHGMKMQPYPDNMQGAPDVMTNGKASLYLEQDNPAPKNLGEGILAIFSADKNAEDVQLFCKSKILW